ncbi:DNA translocase FtsK [Gracilibacillus caseinilyticus]|uniref:DNA translocase FtsK n=1 Tax=Gracilibacillus caseinilyticus TaxID=2932256 RepID=A0ABY4ERP5_9BACI|nr:DNA translocase FtsK [Gracilibacillus caseinilyticus]UOQ47109.1 DNA translocase FtsK [Gracilibacillus caseinilyticus]
MWKNIKKKWEHLFDEEEPEIRRQVKQQDDAIVQRKSIETKMAYQYPKSNNTEIRQKRQSVHTNKEYKNKEQYKQRETESEVRHEPFKVQEIPSPIHGFRPRINRTTERVTQNEVNPEPDKSDMLNMQADQEQKEDLLVGKDLTTDSNTNELADEERENEPVIEEPVLDESPLPKENEQPNDQKTVQLSKVMEKRQKTRSDRKVRPLNVMMTPRDKWHHDQKRQTKGQQVKNETPQQQPVQPVTPVQPEKPVQGQSDHVEQPHSDINSDINSDIKRSVPFHLLNDVEEVSHNHETWVEEQSQKLQTTLRYFNIKANVVDATQGPSVTRFEIQPEPGVKVSKIKNLTDDIKLNLAAKDIRMEAPIPGKNTIGIEVPNEQSEPVFLQKMLESDAFQHQSSPLTVALGADIEGQSVVTDLKKMPHGLIAGATGSGKSVCINTILISLLYKANHHEVKFLLIDPKMVELTPYNDIPHLVSPVITDVKAATAALKWAVAEMEDRYEKFVAEGARDINRFNEKMKQQNRPEDHLPYMVIVIDELADLMMTSPQDVEDAICRIAQKARACGIHLLIATQRPSVDVITGLIKANIPTRIAFSVSSQVDSRTILDNSGAEKLLGKGDMLFVESGSSDTKRIQGAFVSDDEIERITNYVKQMASPNYLFEQEQLIQHTTASEETDELYSEAIQFVMDYNGASASLLQRRFKIGYNRAARLIDMMEDNGIISGQNGSKQREILVSSQDIRQNN